MSLSSRPGLARVLTIFENTLVTLSCITPASTVFIIILGYWPSTEILEDRYQNYPLLRSGEGGCAGTALCTKPAANACG